MQDYSCSCSLRWPPAILSPCHTLPQSSMGWQLKFCAPAGKPHIGCSASGHCVSVVWPQAREYLIFIAGEAGTWDKLTEGVGTHLVSFPPALPPHLIKVVKDENYQPLECWAALSNARHVFVTRHSTGGRAEGSHPRGASHTPKSNSADWTSCIVFTGVGRQLLHLCGAARAGGGHPGLWQGQPQEE